MADNAGAGYIINMLDEKKTFFGPLGKFCTVFQAEAIAMIKAADHLVESNTQGKIIEFYCDNQALIKCFNKVTYDDLLITELFSIMAKLRTTNEVKIIWIRGHTGNLGNEIADRLAKRGSKLAFYGPEPAVPISWTTLRTAVKTITEGKHRKEWLDSSTSNHTRWIWGELNRGKSRVLTNLKVTNIGRMVQMITGHGMMAKHQHRLGNTDNPLIKATM